MKLKILLLSILLAQTLILPAKAEDSIRNINFNNFRYTLKEGGMGPSGNITLKQGRYKDTEGYGFVELNSVTYRDIDGNGVEDALVILGASGGGSGYSTHGYVFTYEHGSVRQIFYQMNFQDIKAYGLGLVIQQTSPLSTGKLVCPGNFLLGADAVDIRLYEWNSKAFIPTRKTTLQGKQLCNLFL